MDNPNDNSFLFSIIHNWFYTCFPLVTGDKNPYISNNVGNTFWKTSQAFFNFYTDGILIRSGKGSYMGLLNFNGGVFLYTWGDEWLVKSVIDSILQLTSQTASYFPISVTRYMSWCQREKFYFKENVKEIEKSCYNKSKLFFFWDGTRCCIYLDFRNTNYFIRSILFCFSTNGPYPDRLPLFPLYI